MSGIYIHIPFCSKRCNYCDFYLITNLNVIGKFLISLKKEISLYTGSLSKESFDTIYFGGGTPSLLSAIQIADIIDCINSNFNIRDDAEITIESNPEDFIDKSFDDYRSVGINRISFGVQSFIDSELKFLTRQHTSEEAENVIRKARKCFDNVNIDIIYSLPRQTVSDLDKTLSKAIALDTDHVSAYTLTYEERTPLFKSLKDGKIKRSTGDHEFRQFNFVSEKLFSAGFEHYEVSNFAKKDKKSRHNLKYWNYHNYLGLGPSSHSMINGIRWNNYREIIKYNTMLSKTELPVENKFELTLKQKKLEFLMLALRSEGVNYEKYKQIFSEEFSSNYKDSIAVLIKNEFAANNGKHFRLTEKGYAIADEIVARYF